MKKLFYIEFSHQNVVNLLTGVNDGRTNQIREFAIDSDGADMVPTRLSYSNRNEKLLT